MDSVGYTLEEVEQVRRTMMTMALMVGERWLTEPGFDGRHRVFAPYDDATKGVWVLEKVSALEFREVTAFRIKRDSRYERKVKEDRFGKAWVAVSTQRWHNLAVQDRRLGFDSPGMLSLAVSTDGLVDWMRRYLCCSGLELCTVEHGASLSSHVLPYRLLAHRLQDGLEGRALLNGSEGFALDLTPTGPGSCVVAHALVRDDFVRHYHHLLDEATRLFAGAQPLTALPECANSTRDSAHYAYGQEKRREIAKRYLEDKAAGEVESKSQWLRRNDYSITPRTLDNYVKKLPET